jgi:hypothetical protein
MIIATYKNNINKYGRFFLATEANPTHVHKNTKVLNISPGRGRRIDFSKAAKGDDDYESDDSNITANDDDLDSDDTYFSDMHLDDDDDDMGEDSDTDIDTDDTDFGDMDDTDGEENTGDETTTDSGDTTGGGNEGGNTSYPDTNTDGGSDDAPDTGDDTDFNDPSAGGEDGGDGGDSVDSPPDTADDPNTDNEDGEKGPGLEYASTRKYALFLNFEILLNALTNYINKLENNIGDDLNTNKILKAACTKLREIKDLCYEYMIMKFELDTYVKALLFYQNAVVMTQAVFTLLQRIKVHKKKLMDMKKKPNHKATLK